MKRSPFKRSAKRVNPRNTKRAKQRHARSFGAEAEAVRASPCLVTGTTPSEPAHVVSRGAGGGRFDLISLSPAMHRQQHGVGVESFAAAHRLDLRAEADRVALLHAPPLGVRGLAQRWAAWEMPLPEGVADSADGIQAWNLVAGDRLDDYEREALLGWVRRRMERMAAAWSSAQPEWPEWDTTAAWFDVADALGLGTEQAHALCELAGWPS